MTRFIKLTRVLADINEKGKRKMDSQIKEKFDSEPNIKPPPLDDYGRSADWYREQELPVPDGLDVGNDTTQVHYAGHIEVKLDPEDYDYSFFEYLCNVEYVESIEATETYTLIGFTSGNEVEVTQTVKEIEKLINKENGDQ